MKASYVHQSLGYYAIVLGAIPSYLCVDFGRPVGPLISHFYRGPFMLSTFEHLFSSQPPEFRVSSASVLRSTCINI